MNKNDIKAKWGKYADTDKLVDDMMALLTKYQHRNTEHGVCCILDQFFTNKEPLIKLMQKSTSYTGDLRIVLDEQLERRRNEYEIRNWVNWFSSAVGADEFLLKDTDSHGKKMTDYLKVGKQKLSIDDFANEETQTIINAISTALAEFSYDGFTLASHSELELFNNTVVKFSDITSSTITDEHLERFVDYKIPVGMKTSRAFNKICHHFTIDTAPKYNKLFAQYADMVSGLKRNIKFFISVNPLDYLTMSFGVNWESCHTINKHDRNNGYSGRYCGGTMSYMLDQVSIITYVHNTMPENYETGKVYRNMFHLGNDGMLLQGRIYPQGNDGCTDLYKEFRAIVQKELTNLLGLDANKWTKKSAVNNIASVGSHYRDYAYNSSCNISYPTERPQCSQQIMTVGSIRICPYCGASADDLQSGNLAHATCKIV